MDPFGLLPLGLVVVGWIVVNWQNDRRESRKEARAAADRAKRLIAEVAISSLDHMKAPSSEKAAMIKLMLEEAELELEVFPHFAVKDNPLMKRLIQFQDAVTGGDFESASSSPKDGASPEAVHVRVTRNALLSEIEHQFRASFN